MKSLNLLDRIQSLETQIALLLEQRAITNSTTQTTSKEVTTTSLQLAAPEKQNLVLSSSTTIKVKANQVQLQAPSVLFQSKNCTIEGELAAKMSYSQTFTWYNGQQALRIYAAQKGFPIITGIELMNNTDKDISVNTFIHPEDQYWYIEGSAGVKAISVIFVGNI